MDIHLLPIKITSKMIAKKYLKSFFEENDKSINNVKVEFEPQTSWDVFASIDNYKKGLVYQSKTTANASYAKAIVKIVMSPNVKDIIIAYRDQDEFKIFKKEVNILEHTLTKEKRIYQFEVEINGTEEKIRRAIYVILIPRMNSFKKYRSISVFDFYSISKIHNISSNSITVNLFGSLQPKPPVLIKNVSPKMLNEKEKEEYGMLISTLYTNGYIYFE